MGAGQFVGRLGALAVALGVGAAVTLSPGVACADTSDSHTGSSVGGATSDGAASGAAAGQSEQGNSSQAMTGAGTANVGTDSSASTSTAIRRSMTAMATLSWYRSNCVSPN